LKFLEAVSQQISGVVGNVIYCFVENLTLSSSQKFLKSAKIWRNYCHFLVRHFPALQIPVTRLDTASLLQTAACFGTGTFSSRLL